MKKKLIVWSILFIACVAAVLVLTIPAFDKQEAAEAVGEVTDISEEWMLVRGDGTKGQVSLPLQIKDEDVIYLRRKLSADCSGLSVSVTVNNGAMRALLSGKHLYDKGYEAQHRNTRGRRWTSKSVAGTEQQAGTGQQAGTEQQAGTGQQTGTEQQTSSEQRTGTEQQTGTGQRTSTERQTTSGQGSEASETPKEENLSASGQGSEAAETSKEENLSASGQGSEAAESPKKENSSALGRIGLTDDVQGLEKNFDRRAISESGDNIIDLGDGVSDSDILSLRIDRVDSGKPIKVSRITVAKRDAAVMNSLRTSFLPMICCILIILTIPILLLTDIIRVSLTHKPAKGVAVLGLFMWLALVYAFIESGVMITFFGNSTFFYQQSFLISVLMPMVLGLYQEMAYGRFYPKRSRVVFWITMVASPALLVMYVSGVQKNNAVLQVPAGFLIAFVSFMIIYSLYCMKREGGGRLKVGAEIGGFSVLCFGAVASALNRLTEIMTLSDEGLYAAIGLAFFAICVTGQHVFVMMKDYRMDVEKTARELEDKNLQLVEAKEEAELANASKSRFLANMSHEIRTPINAVLGMDEMIMRETRDKVIRGYATDIYTSGQTLLALINDILDFSKIESGKLEIVPAEYDISSLIHDLYNMIQARVQAKDLRLELEVDENIPSSYYGDDVRIRQVITNILTNAVKYTPEGTVWFRISGKRQKDVEILHFEVEDTGIGIREEDLPKLFQAYERIEEGRNRNIEGTGLGMNITLQLLGLMGSRLEVTSEYGKGSKFWFDIEQPIRSEVPIGDFEERIRAFAQEGFQYTNGFTAPEASVLVVDDNAMNRKVFVSLLKPTKVRITEADGGAASIELASHEHFDIIFMDHMMPEIDGIEAFHRIRALGEDSPNAHTPVFILTANAVTGAKEKYLEEGFDGFLSKPIVSEKLEKAIAETLPTELLQPPDPDAQETESVSSGAAALPEDLPDVDGLDWNIAWLHLPGREILEDAVREFYAIIELHGDKLDAMYERLPEEAAVNDYRIQVHSMKSTAGTLGILPLAGMAKVLEFAAKDGDIDRIRAMHGIFMEEWRGYKEKLNGVFGLGADEAEENQKPPADPQMTGAYLTLLGEAMEDFDVDEADRIMGELAGFRYEPAIEEDIKQLRGAVSDLDSDSAAEIIERIMERLS